MSIHQSGTESSVRDGERRLAEVTKESLTRKSISSSLSNFLIERVFALLGFMAIFILGLILFYLFREGLDAIREIGFGEFLFAERWYPSSSEPGFGAKPFIISSIMVTAGALIIAIPWSIFTAIFIAEVAPRKIREVLKPMVEFLEIFPSVILGFIALVILSPIVADLFGLSNGMTAFTAAVILSVMALPTIVSISEDAIKAVPNRYKEAAIALGATRWEVIKTVSLPAAKSGIMAAIMLGFGRAIGETMTVLMAAGNAIDMPLVEFFGLVLPDFFTSVRTLTANIAIEGSDVAWGSLHYSALFVLGLILFTITFIVNLIADWLIHRQRERFGHD